MSNTRLTRPCSEAHTLTDQEMNLLYLKPTMGSRLTGSCLGAKMVQTIRSRYDEPCCFLGVSVLKKNIYYKVSLARVLRVPLTDKIVINTSQI